MIGVIGGSGLYQLPGFELKEERQIQTPYGSPSDTFRMGRLKDKDVAFLARHGRCHDIPPHRVNYRANIWAMKEIGVGRIIAVNAVGGITAEPGSIVVPDQIVDFTKGRKGTFFDGPEVVHVDFTEPFCPEMRGLFNDNFIGYLSGGAYVCTEGPRLESKAEIGMFKTLGFDIVGMTGLPEAALARELELCYMMIAIVTNYAAGIKDSPLTTKEVLEMMEEKNREIKEILTRFIPLLPEVRNCPCPEATKEARL